MRLTLSRDSIILIAIGMADLISTVILLNAGGAVEGNPVMAYFLRYGICVFILMKMMLISIPVMIFEYCRQFKPKFVALMVRFAITAYVAVYASLYLTINVA